MGYMSDEELEEAFIIATDLLFYDKMNKKERRLIRKQHCIKSEDYYLVGQEFLINLNDYLIK